MSGALLKAAGVFFGLLWTGVNVSSIRVGATATSGFRFNTDGTISENDDGAYSQVGTWYKGAPRSGIGTGFEVRALSAGKVGTWSSSAAADDVWTTITVGREWNVQQASPGVKTTSATFEIRPLSGTAQSATGQASAEYTT